MSIPDMDVTALRDPSSVKYREFARVRKGYDPDQVRAYLEQLSGWLQDLERELRDARTTARMTARQPERAPEDQFAELGARVAEFLRTAEQHAEQVKREAEEAAERTREEARQEALLLRQTAEEETTAARRSAGEEAEATRSAAQEEADRVRQEAARALEVARVEAERSIASLSVRRNALAAELLSTRERLMGIVSQLADDASAADVDSGRSAGADEVAPELVASDDPLRAEISGIPLFAPPEPPRAPPMDAGEGRDVISFAEADEEDGTGAPGEESTVTRSENEGPIEDFFAEGASIDLGLTDFPSFDLPSLEDDEQPRN